MCFGYHGDNDIATQLELAAGTEGITIIALRVDPLITPKAATSAPKFFIGAWPIQRSLGGLRALGVACRAPQFRSAALSLLKTAAADRDL